MHPAQPPRAPALFPRCRASHRRPTADTDRRTPTIGPVTALILAHGADGLAGDGVPSALLYGIVVAGALVFIDISVPGANVHAMTAG